MYKEFSVISIEPLMAKKQIVITTNKELNILDFDNKTIIEIYERDTKTPVTFTTDIKDEVLTITLNDWPLPNSEYILSVKNLLSITDETLESNIKRKIVFKSDITSTINIISPCMNELIENLNINFEEINKEKEKLINSYYVEIATDNAFINRIIKSAINTTNITFTTKYLGQMFLRVRAQDNINGVYGPWSEVISFRYKKEDYDDSDIKDEIQDDPIDDDSQEDEPIVDLEEFKIVKELEQGVTPSNSLLIEFSKEVDSSTLDNIVILKRRVR